MNSTTFKTPKSKPTLSETNLNDKTNCSNYFTWRRIIIIGNFYVIVTPLHNPLHNERDNQILDFRDTIKLLFLSFLLSIVSILFPLTVLQPILIVSINLLGRIDFR